ncbi:hypothetical protein GUJ93_ZPchr0003g16917 [Zizania palustris]|uniref:Ribosomal RNA large subunit methyltransferase K/L-like methyltransferase domain-containing protein n=1 Tax=Zizania palustris TaxID=103762 RepID=A0A8J5RW20_ZIZPA|nr:hypothetical protein GUJ93_ZPchr0003g16917 [Zizania palustris]
MADSVHNGDELDSSEVFLPAFLPPLGRLPFAASPHLSLRPPPRLLVAVSAPSARLPVAYSTPSARLPASRWPPPRPPPASPPLGDRLRALRLPPRLPVAASVPPGGRLRTLRLVDSSAPSASRWLPPRLPVVASASSGQARPGKLVYDPFVGTGSILVAAAHYGAMTMGADIDIRVVLDGHGPDCNIWSNFEQYKLPEPLCVLRADNNVPPWRSGLKEIFDAIICDPPYGVRAGGRKSGGRKVIKGAVAPYTIPDEKRDNHIHFSIHNGVGAYV